MQLPFPTPVIFSDNYISLAPGESRTITCSYENRDAGSAAPYIVVSGWNLDTNNSKGINGIGFSRESKE